MRRLQTVCIDGRDLALARGTGIATYGHNLLGALSAIGTPGEVLYGVAARRAHTNRENEALIAANSETDRFMDRRRYFLRTLASPLGRKAYSVEPSAPEAWPEGRRPEARRYWWSPSLFRFGARAFRKYGSETPVRFANVPTGRPDVMHWTSPMPIYAARTRNLYTFHDLIPLTHPHLVDGDVGAVRRLYKTVVARADHLAVVSETTRRDLIENLGVNEDRITNTYQAVVTPQAIVDADQEDLARELRDTFGLPWKAYFLHYGAIEPKKNFGRIVEAYIASGARSPLVLVGNPAWMSAADTALLEKVRREGLNAGAKIRQYDYLPRRLLQILIRGARATLFPSLYEGFGLPVLESMALGSAVLTSTAGSLPEISGGAALLVNPESVTALAAGIVTLDEDADMRADLVQRGYVRAEHFTPAAYQARLKILYSKVGLDLTGDSAELRNRAIGK